MVANNVYSNYTGFGEAQTIIPPNWKGTSGGKMSLVSFLFTPKYIIAMADGRSVDGKTNISLRDDFVKIVPFNDMLFFSTGQNDFMRERNGNARSSAFEEYINSKREHLSADPIQSLHFLRDDIYNHLKFVTIGIVKFVKMYNGCLYPSLSFFELIPDKATNNVVQQCVYNDQEYKAIFFGEDNAVNLGKKTKISICNFDEAMDDHAINITHNEDKDALSLKSVFEEIRSINKEPNPIGEPNLCYVLNGYQYRRIYI